MMMPRWSRRLFNASRSLKDLSLETLVGAAASTLAHHADEMVVPGGTRLLEAGQRSDQLILVLSGRIRLDSAGRGQGSLGPGDWLAPTRRAAVGLLAEDDLRVVVIHRRHLPPGLRIRPANTGRRARTCLARSA